MIKDIMNGGILLAQFYDMNLMDGTSFPTPESAPLQFGYGDVSKGVKLIPHIHKRVSRKIEATSEFLYVIQGEMSVIILDEEECFVEKVVLQNNMALLQFIGGHSIEVKDGTKYFEIKQGPYYGRDFDKYNIKF